MSLLKADLLAKLRENGAEIAADHKPILYLGIHFKGKTFGGFLLTRINTEHRKEVCSLIDFVVWSAWICRGPNWFEATYPISVYKKAFNMMSGLISTNKAAPY